MNKQPDIQKRVDEAMSSLDNITPAGPNPFFFTRLEARMNRNERNVWEQLSRVITRPAFAALTLSLVLIMNAYVAVQGVTASNQLPDVSEMASTDDLRETSFYDIENLQP